MAKTVVGMFDKFSDAQAAVTDLLSSGFDRKDISVVKRQDEATSTTAQGRTRDRTDAGDVDPGTGAAIGAGTGAVIGGAAGLALSALGGIAIPGLGALLGVGPIVATTLGGAGIGAAAGGLAGALMAAGVPEEHAQYYVEGIRRGGTLVTVRASDEMADRAAEILSRHNAIDIDERATQWRSSGWTAETATAATARTTERRDTTRAAREEQAAIPVVEEQLHVGKRQVQRGGVRVYQHVTERPVEEQVELREEQVRVERRPVNQPAEAATMNRAFKEGTIEVTETAEIPVVQKEARVTEEVAIRKDVDTRTETVRDTVRKTDVEVEQVGSQQGQVVDTFVAELARDQRFRGRDWDTVEPDARRAFEQRYPGNRWDQFKDAVHQRYERARAKA
jgi:uncharacterized protein (TIGR02271 family)